MTNLTRIPYRIRIGVTGHRALHDTPMLNNSLHGVLNAGYLEAFIPEARLALDKTTNTPIAFSMISPLAEGADRLAAYVGLKHGGLLEALLPMPREEYEKDFATLESRKEFADLLALAQRVTVLEGEVSPADVDCRHAAYRRVGAETVARCDILIALWDGEPSRGMGGTADVVALALEQKKPVFIVSTSQPGKIELNNGGTLNAEFVTELERFNSSSLDEAKLEACCNNEYRNIFPSPQADAMPDHLKETVRTHLLPSYCRASKIAEKYQTRYKRTGWLGYLLSTLSVAFMAFAVIFTEHPLFSIPGYVAELCLLISLYIMIHRAEHARVHPGWLEHRALAERLRTACYFVVCGESPAVNANQRFHHHHEQSWVDRACLEIFSGLPDLSSPSTLEVRQCLEFLDTAWVQGQIDYHTRNAEKLTKKNNSLKRWGIRCFKLAIGISLVHLSFALYGAVTGHHAEGMMLLLEELLSIIAITLPAAGAAVGGYRSLLEQSRIAARSRAVVQHLSKNSEPSSIDDPAALRRYLENIQDVMLIESEDWLALMEHAELERIA